MNIITVQLFDQFNIKSILINDWFVFSRRINEANFSVPFQFHEILINWLAEINFWSFLKWNWELDWLQLIAAEVINYFVYSACCRFIHLAGLFPPHWRLQQQFFLAINPIQSQPSFFILACFSWFAFWFPPFFN